MPTTDERDKSRKDGTEKPVAVSSTSLDSMHMINSGSNSSTNNPDRTSALEPTMPYIRVPAPQKVSPVLTHQTNQSDLQRPSFLSSSMLGLTQPAGGAVPEFLYQLTKMLTDNNREVIEWSNGMIKVHNPPKLESQVMHKYFRHSKFSSFQRQLNYFGFRKLAGKGKMAPCSYVNESTGKEINSLLRIKRKSGVTIPPTKEEERSRPVKNKTSQQPVIKPAKLMPPPTRANPVGHGSVRHSNQCATSSQLALARTAVGRGIRHGVTLSSKPTPVTDILQVPDPLLQHRSDSLSQLASNYQHSLDDYRSQDDARAQNNEQYQGHLSRDSSLVDLAMIPSLDDMASYHPESTISTKDEFGWGFVDFPYPELDPGSNVEQG